jgi:hypothetical protein
MATQHNYIMPFRLNTQFEGDIETMMDICFAEAVLTAVEYSDDTCSLTMTVDTGEEKELITRSNVPIHYHCPKKETIDGGSIAFKVNDTVLVCNHSGNCDWRNDEIKVIGFPNQLKTCLPYIYIRIGHWSFLWDVSTGAYATGIKNPRYGNPSYPDANEYFVFPEEDWDSTNDFYAYRTTHLQNVEELASQTQYFDPITVDYPNCGEVVETTFVKNDQTNAVRTKSCSDEEHYTALDEIYYANIVPSQQYIKDNQDKLYAVHTIVSHYYSNTVESTYNIVGDIVKFGGTTSATGTLNSTRTFTLSTPLAEELLPEDVIVDAYVDSEYQTFDEDHDIIHDSITTNMDRTNETLNLSRLASQVYIHRESGVMLQLYLFASCKSMRHRVNHEFGSSDTPSENPQYSILVNHAPQQDINGQYTHRVNIDTSQRILIDETTYDGAFAICHAMAEIVDNLIDVDNKVTFDIHNQSVRSGDFEFAVLDLYDRVSINNCSGYNPVLTAHICKQI